MELSISQAKLTAFFENNGKKLYLPQHTNLTAFVQIIQKWFASQSDFQYHIRWSEHPYFIFGFSQKSSVKDTLGMSDEYFLLLKQIGEYIYYGFDKASEFSEEAKKSNFLGKIFSGNESVTVEKQIQFLITEQYEQQIDKKIHESLLIEEIDSWKKNWFYYQIVPQEELLAWLNISEIQLFPENFPYLKQQKSYFVVSNIRQSLITVNEKNEIFCQYISGEDFQHKSEIGRDTIISNGFRWLSTRNNEDLFAETAKMMAENEYERKKIAVHANIYNPLAKKEHTPFALLMLDKLIEEHQNPIDKLVKIFESAKPKANQLPETEELTAVLNEIINAENSDFELMKWQEQWYISPVQSIGINQVLMQIANPDTFGGFVEFHKSVRSQFIKKNKDLIELSLFDIQYAKHLITTDAKQEATEILTKRLEALPDETVLDLLPDDHVDPTETNKGQLLKITILDLLVSISEGKELENYLRTLAMLQPLAPNRLEMLRKNAKPELSQRVENILDILKGKSERFSNASPTYNLKLGSKNIEKYLQHPATRKGGTLNSLQKWLAKIDVPDYSVLKTYSQKVSPSEHSELFELINAIASEFGIKGLEAYVSHGEKSVGISSFEGKVPFLIIGAKHLDQKSDHYLFKEELQFIIGREIANLYFKHSRITSNDVWKGVMDKGTWMIDTIFSTIPLIGLIGNAFKTATKLNQIVKVLQKAETINNITQQGKEIVVNTNKRIGIFSKNTDKSTKEQNLIATSRAMQLTADRTGLVFSQQLDAAVHAIFKQSDFYFSLLNLSLEEGAEFILHEKNEEGKYTYIELAIRISHLFSFYLSPDFEKLLTTK